MNNEEGAVVKVTKLNNVGKDSRGLTANFFLPRKQAEFIFITRKASTLSGNTYHEGKHPATNPKIFVLLSGMIRLSYRKIGSNEKFSIEIDFPATIEISPFVTHKVEVLTDCILLECNSISDIQNDRVKENI